MRSFVTNGGVLKLIGERHGVAFTVMRGGKDLVGGIALLRAQVVELRDSLNEVLGESTHVEVACGACKGLVEQCETCGGFGKVLRRA